MEHYKEVLKILHDEFDWKLNSSLTKTGQKLVADTLKALKIAENNQALKLQQNGVSGSLFSEMNTEMLKISVAMQNIKQSEFIEDYKFHKTTSKKDIKTFLNAIKQQNERLVILNQRMIRLRERFSKNYQ